jgi:hypothetical protein
MSFLPSPTSDPCKLVLLILVCTANGEDETHQLIYSCDLRKPLTTLRPMSYSGRRLRETQLPTMLIPSSQPYSFMVIMPTGISYYENIHLSDMKRVHCSFALDSDHKLEWVQWARPRRHTKYLRRHDDIVILREDGLLKNFSIDKDSKSKFNSNNTIGHLSMSVDAAFCMLSGPPSQGGDIIIAAGSMTGGGVYHVTARGLPQRIQHLETLAPLSDIVTSPSITAHSEESKGGQPARLLACSGPHGGKGQSSEIRYGSEAQVGWTMDLPDAAMVERLFSLEIADGKQLFLLASQITNSSMLVHELDTQEIFFANEVSHPGIDFDHGTLAAAVVDRDVVIQVTTMGIRAVCVRPGAEITLLSKLDHEVAHATFLGNEQSLAMVIRSTERIELCLVDIVHSKGSKSTEFHSSFRKPLFEMPQSICSFKMEGNQFVFLGLGNGKILGFDEQARQVLQYDLEEMRFPAVTTAIVSIVVLSHEHDGPALLLCGLRSGVLICFAVHRHGTASECSIGESGTNTYCVQCH